MPQTRPDHSHGACLSGTMAMSGRQAIAYEGMAFRYQSRGAGKPEEFIQAGFEIIGGTDRDVADDGQVLRDMVQTIEALGVADYDIRLNHFGMLPVLLQGLGLTPRAAARLERAYHQSADFDAMVGQMLAEQSSRAQLADLSVNPNGPVIAGRSPADIASTAGAFAARCRNPTDRSAGRSRDAAMAR